MGIIQCAQDCKYQKDGYCYLDKCSVVASLDTDCPHFVQKSFDNTEGLFKTGSAYEF